VILVTIGSAEPFDRLLRAVDGLPGPETVIAQCGASTVLPRRAECLDFVRHEDLIGLMREARVVVTHAGVGSVLAATTTGRPPIVVPRLAGLREAVDDHQLLFGRRLAAEGRVVLVEDVADLPDAVAGYDAPPPAPLGPSELATELRRFMATHIERLERTP
jgi:UDP-N-acetylglucosamine transferase subunit ALG13